ncbi:MAG TPA: acyl-homoserine-lactone synthase [Asticcacaulis sp.]|nr:acyl-homoserine-lactone synthase [Asticcacaulis sp.]
MLRAISYKSISHYPDLFFGQFRLRHQEFIERQAYRVRTLDGLEFDEYDTLASVYLVYSEDDKTVLGCSRLTPLGYGCMLADHFPQLVDAPARLGRPGVWEGTRFCIDRRLSADLRRRICHHLCLGYLEYALAQGISEIIGVMPTLVLRTVFERSGIQLERLGDVHRLDDNVPLQAAAICVTEAQLAACQARTGLVSALCEVGSHGRRHVA